MALTMTRTRTQTTLTKLVKMVAEVQGELVFVERLLGEVPEHKGVLEARRDVLLRDRDALYLTLKQFDSEIEPEEIKESNGWQKAKKRFQYQIRKEHFSIPDANPEVDSS